MRDRGTASRISSCSSRGCSPRGERIFERFGLFYLIALGEGILTTGTAIAANLEGPLILLTGTVALAGSVAIWWCYFYRLEQETLDRLASAADHFRPGVVAGNTFMVLLAALILVAVGDELVISHPLECDMHAPASA